MSGNRQLKQKIKRFFSSDVSESDEDIIAQILAGNTKRFEILVERYENIVFRFILKYVPGDVAEDLAQDTFISAFESLSKFTGHSKFSSWLIGIALNKARNYLNRSPDKRYEHISEDYILQNLDKNIHSQEEVDSKLHLKFLLDQLTEDYKDPLVLISLEGMSYEEAAEILNMPIGTVRTRIHRARQRIKEIVDQEDKKTETF